jgi:hypothetical protein
MAERPCERQTAREATVNAGGSLAGQREDQMWNRTRSALVVVAGTLSVAVWIVGGTPRVGAQSDDSYCSNRTLRGNYGGSFDGQISTPAGTVLLRGLVLTQFDGAGNLRQMEFLTANGAPPPTGEWTPTQGTYQIATDCTGVAEIVQSNGNILRQRWVVVNRGREIRAVVEGAIAGGTRVKID